jgi:hypothetical protein
LRSGGLPPAAFLTGVIAFLPPEFAYAPEAAAGRYIPGVFAQPGAGVVPPVPGFYWGVSHLVYDGSASANIDVPIGDDLVFGLKARLFSTVIGGMMVPDFDLPGNWTYAVQVGVPLVNWSWARADLNTLTRIDEKVAFGDMSFTPVLLGWHNEALDTFFNVGLTVFAPTGFWAKDNIAIIGLNYWTFTPAIGFTRIWAEEGIDFSMKAGIDLNTTNKATDYYSGAMAHFDASLTKNLTENFALGVFGGVLWQVEDDRGGNGLADRLDGFRGRQLTVGPLLKYKAKFDRTEIDFTLSWAPEFYTKNRLEGNAVFLNASGKF